jgi:hypothetical protein
MMTPESLSRECSPTPQEIILAAPGSSPDQGTTISIPDLKVTDSKIQLGGPGGQTLKLTSGGLQLTSLAPGQPLQLTAAGQLVTSNGAPLQPAQILTNGGTIVSTPLNTGKLIMASPVSTPRLIVPAAQLTMVQPSPEKAPGVARIVSLGGVTLTSADTVTTGVNLTTLTTPSPNVSNIIQRAKQNVTSSTPVLLQPANSVGDVKRVYNSMPPANTPITPGTQIILSEGVATSHGGMVSPLNMVTNGMPRVSINPIVSLPLHPVPQSQVTGAMTSNSVSITSGSVVVTPSNGTPAPLPPLPTPSVSLSMVDVREVREETDKENGEEPPSKRFKIDVAPIGH